MQARACSPRNGIPSGQPQFFHTTKSAFFVIVMMQSEEHRR
jgi:hypothetical protein